MALKFSKSLAGILKRQKQLTRLIMKVARPVVLTAKPARVSKGPRAVPRRLTQVVDFGSNPGRLTMMQYIPAKLEHRSPLVVVLHGCLQTAQGFDDGAGFTALARERRFAVLYPEQTRSNNANLCFNWFRPSAVARDRGELQSIRQMIDHVCAENRLDPARVYIVGLSAGGAMASALLATYPERFAAGAIVAGLPFGAARDAMTALSVMKSGASRSGQEWGDLVRAVSPTQQHLPKLSVWQGSGDRIVNPLNAEASVRQWLNIRGIEAVPATVTEKSWGRVTEWRQGGVPVVSLYTLDGLAHGVPVKASKAVGARRIVDRYILDAPVSAPLELMTLWGLKRR